MTDRDPNKSLNVAIVGGGPGCKAIMEMIFADKLSQLRMHLVGVADRNADAVGYRFAQDRGIFTTHDYRDFYKLEDLNMIIELTGRDRLTNEIAKTMPEDVRLMNHVVARLFWDVFQIEERRISEQRSAEAALRESEQKYSSLVENALTGIYIDKEGNIVFCNDKFYEPLLNETGFIFIESYEQVTLWANLDTPELEINQIVRTNHVPTLLDYLWGIIPITWVVGFLLLLIFKIYRIREKLSDIIYC